MSTFRLCSGPSFPRPSPGQSPVCRLPPCLLGIIPEFPSFFVLSGEKEAAFITCLLRPVPTSLKIMLIWFI
jgi:hypothetical protein